MNATTQEYELDDLDAYIAGYSAEEHAELAVAGLAVDLALLLHDARIRRQLSQQQAAVLAGLNQQAVSRLERPQTNVTIGTVGRYLAALGYTAELIVREPSGAVVGVSVLGPPSADRQRSSLLVGRSAAG